MTKTELVAPREAELLALNAELATFDGTVQVRLLPGSVFVCAGLLSCYFLRPIAFRNRRCF